jgi:hypothetical protein
MRHRPRKLTPLVCAVGSILGVVLGPNTPVSADPHPLGASPRDAPLAQALMNHYQVKTEFGSFEVHSDAMLRRLRSEQRAIASLREVSRAEAFGDSLTDAVVRPFQGAKELVTEPGKTVTAVTDALSRLPGRARAAVAGSASVYEDNIAKAMLSVTKRKREYADALGVDVYSSNRVLQKELDSVAWTEAAGGLGVSTGIGIATFGGSLATSNLTRASELRDILRTRSATELRMDSRKALEQSGVSKRVISRFLDHKWYSPRHEIMIAVSLKGLGAAQGRDLFVDRALTAKSEDSALFFQQMAEMINGYHRSVAPVDKISVFFGIPLAHDAKGGVAILLPIDHCQWTGRISDVATHVVAHIRARYPGVLTSLWTPGTITPRAQEGFAALGIKTHPRSDAILPLLD